MMPRAAIYARYSTEMQSDASIADQVRDCRARAEGDGYEVVRVYADRALSGASMHGRDEVRAMVADARARRFSRLYCEDLSRLSRSMADIATIHDELTFADVQIHTLHDHGPVTRLHVGFKGTMNAVERDAVRARVLRGLRGVAHDGRISAPPAYGYAKRIGDKPGVWDIVEARAAVVRRIFERFALGEGAAAIARALNADGIPGPRGSWQASTISGQARRGTGILNNTLYIGQWRFNRQTYRADPRTGKRLARANTEDAVLTVDVPHLRIVSDDLWHAARNRPRRPGGRRSGKVRHLVSGLVECASCGGNMSVANADTLRCTNRTRFGTCDNSRGLRLDVVTPRVLDALRAHLSKPAFVQTFIRAYRAEWSRLESDSAGERPTVEAELERARAGLANLVAAVEAGQGGPALFKAMDARDAEVAALEARLNALPSHAPLPLPKDIAAQWGRTLRDLDRYLRDGMAVEARAALHSIVSRVVATPGNAGYALEVSGPISTTGVEKGPDAGCGGRI